MNHHTYSNLHIVKKYLEIGFRPALTQPATVPLIGKNWSGVEIGQANAIANNPVLGSFLPEASNGLGSAYLGVRDSYWLPRCGHPVGSPAIIPWRHSDILALPR